MSDDQNKYWVLPLHLRIHQITTKHRPVVLLEDYERLLAEAGEAFTKGSERIDGLRRELVEARELLRETAPWLGDNDHEESLARRIRAFIANYPENDNSTTEQPAAVASTNSPEISSRLVLCPACDWRVDPNDGLCPICDKELRVTDKSEPLDMEPGPGGSRVLVVKEK